MNQIPNKIRLYRMSMTEHECPWGLKAIALLNEKGLAFEDVRLTTREAVEAFKAQHQVATTPQIFFDEERIGGYSDMAKKLGGRGSKSRVFIYACHCCFWCFCFDDIGAITRLDGFYGDVACDFGIAQTHGCAEFLCWI